MREILFRAKIKANNNYSLYSQEEIKFLENGLHEVESVSWESQKIMHFAVPYNTERITVFPSKFNADLLQYTGLKDKNGVKIFEGDILKIAIHLYDKVASEGIAEVKYMDNSFGVKWGNRKDFSTFDRFVNTTFEVIGNIYDNPELLEV